MSVEEQQDFIKTLREVSSNSHTLKKLIAGENAKKKKPKEKKGVTVKSILDKLM